MSTRASTAERERRAVDRRERREQRRRERRLKVQWSQDRAAWRNRRPREEG